MKKAILILIIINFYSTNIVAAKEVEETPLDYHNETEASAALLFLDLYNQGLAGGKSGVCVDLNYDADGKPQFKAAFDTSAFETGSSDLKSDALEGQGFNSDSFKKLIDALAKVQNGKVNATVDGYADGQHYASKPPFNLDESIKKNESLSLARATTIGDLIGKNNPNINVNKANGHASPMWEKKYPSMNGGLNCPTRRKVVVTFDQPTPQIKSEMSGSFFRAPESMNSIVKSDIKKEFKLDIKQAEKSLKIQNHNRTSLSKRPSRTDVEKIYSKLMSDKKLNPKCNLSPFKEMTLAMIEIQITNFGSSNTTSKKDDIMESYLKESKMSLNDLSGGVSALQEGCLEPSSALAESMQKSVKDYAVSGGSFMNSAGLKTNNGNVTIGFDINSLQPQKITVGPNKGQTMRGFYCKACGSGLFFHEDSPGHFHTEYVDRVVKFKNGDKDQDKFLSNLNAISNEDPFSVASFIKPRLFVIKNCKDCKCDHTALIKAKDASVIAFDPLSGGGATSQQMPAAEFDNACVIRPPVHHACNVSPNKNDGNDQASFQQKLTYESSMQNLKFSAPNMNDLINKVSNSCDASKKALSADQKISNVMCSADKLRNLPSDDEQADCAAFDAQRAK